MAGGIFEKLEMKVLTYASKLSTDATIEPKADVNSMNGFSYPELKEALGDSSYLDSVVLRKLEDDGCLAGEFRDRTLLCPYCSAYNICFRDVCPECKSANISAVEMIHHFRCGYVGAADEFVRGGKLFCPKCAVPLIHIGKDYERPSEILECHECSWSGSEASTSGHCIFCDREVAPESCRLQDIKAYRISMEGVLSVRSGTIVSRKDTEEEELGSLGNGGASERPFTSVKSLAALAGELGKMSDKFGIPLSAASISLDVFSMAGASMTPDIGQAMSSAVEEKLFALIRETDYLVPVSAGTMILLMPSTTAGDAEKMLSSILDETAKLNFSGPLKRTTLSAGIAAWRKDMDASKLFLEAKGARIKAVSLGGNRIVSTNSK